MPKTPQVDLSIVITAHSEGLVAHKTMLSIHEAIRQLELKKRSYEVIVSIDKGSDETNHYFEYYKKEINPGATILSVNFGDLSTSRNNAARSSHGKFISFLDADDLVSDNWLADGLDTVSSNHHAVIHPEYSITFGDDNLIWQKRNSASTQYDSLCFIDNNLWDSPCIAERELFETVPYTPNGDGFGYEDKHFNLQALAAGYTHMVAPRSLLFVRRKITGSMLTDANSDLVTVAPTKLLSFEEINKIDVSEFAQTTQVNAAQQKAKAIATKAARKVARKIHQAAKVYPAYQSLVTPIKNRYHLKKNSDLTTAFPNWMQESWRRIHTIDNSIFPSRDLLHNLNWYNAENIEPGLRYASLIQSLKCKPDTLFFVPHIIRGGADRLFINYSAELSKSKGWKIAMLQTEAKQSVWKEKIDPGIDFISLYTSLEGLDNPTRYRLMATFVTQNNVRRIVVGNSQFAYDFVNKYETLLKRLDVAIYCFAFGEEFDDEGRLWGHIHTGIPKIYRSVHAIITDNQNTVNKLQKEYAFDPERFRVHYQPTEVEIQHPNINERKPLRVLWASRVCKQKRPDILKAVSNSISSDDFTFDAYGELEEGLTGHYFDDSNVVYKGGFNGPLNLPTNQYDIFLYTSEGDGVPNVLQEMTSAGLPIVASNVGGIKEFVKSDKTGKLVVDHNEIAGYVDALTDLKSAALREQVVNGAQELLKTQFSLDTWKNKIDKDFDR